MSAGAVPVRLLVGADRELRDMRADRVVGDLEADVDAAGAALLVLLQLHVVDVGDEIALPEPAEVQLALAGEVVLLAAEAVLEGKVVVEDEVVDCGRGS